MQIGLFVKGSLEQGDRMGSNLNKNKNFTANMGERNYITPGPKNCPWKKGFPIQMSCPLGESTIAKNCDYSG